MHIAIDGIALLRKTDGVGRYTAELITELIKSHPEHTYEVIGYSDQVEIESLIDKNLAHFSYMPFMRGFYAKAFKLGLAPSVNRWLWRQPDVVIYPNFVAFPKIKAAKKILFVHDTVYEDRPKTLSAKNLRYLTRFVPKSIKETDVLVTISKYSAKRIHEIYSQASSEVIYPAVSSDFKITGKDDILKKYDIKKGYILALGTIEPRKNIDGLLKAYMQLPDKLRKKHQLVLAGKAGWNVHELMAKIDKLQRKGEKIIVTGFIEDYELADLYKFAAVSTQVSFYEGFGIPPIEAMTVGTPVVASKNSAIVEAVKDAALLVQADDSNQIAHALQRLLTDKKLYEEMSAKGKIQAKKFSWKTSARKLAQLL